MGAVRKSGILPFLALKPKFRKTYLRWFVGIIFLKTYYSSNIRKLDMHFNDFIQHVRDNPATAAHRISADWGQGRAIFGGVIGAVLYTAMRREVGVERHLLSFTLSFVAPLEADVDFITSSSILRAGKSAVQIESRIIQNDQTVAVALALFGLLRDSSIQVDAIAAPDAPAPDGLPPLPFIPNVVPEFTKHLQYRWAFGGLPFSGTKSREMGGWVRLPDNADDLNSELDIARLIMLIDAWPPATLPLLAKPAPASSMTWTISFAQPLPAITEWLLYKAEIDHAASGYSQIRSHIWNHAGECVALSSQTVALFD